MHPPELPGMVKYIIHGSIHLNWVVLGMSDRV